MNELRSQQLVEATDELWSLANGPNLLMKFYLGCMCNGVRFHTKDRDNQCKSQNSGLVVNGEYDGKAIDFYGYLCNIWEITYIFGYRVVLFRCEWFNLGSGRTVQTDAHFTSSDVRGRWYQNDPFVLPSQVHQVFYVNDPKLGPHWQIVQRIQHRGIWDIPELGDVESNDDGPSIQNDAFQQEKKTDVVPIVVGDPDRMDQPRYDRSDVDPSIVTSGILSEENSREDVVVDDDFICDDEDETLEEYCDEVEKNLHSIDDSNVESHL
ncbi:hypothetical protein AAC387_Pa04g1700 [Persea americana]